MKHNHFNTAGLICGKIFNELKEKIIHNEILNIKELSLYGNNRINEECSLIYKKSTNKGIAFPVSISLNNCLGNFIYEKENERYNHIIEYHLQ